jgi:hypothetical protein
MHPILTHKHRLYILDSAKKFVSLSAATFNSFPSLRLAADPLKNHLTFVHKNGAVGNRGRSDAYLPGFFDFPENCPIVGRAVGDYLRLVGKWNCCRR